MMRLNYFMNSNLRYLFIILIVAILACQSTKKLKVGFDVDDTILFSSPNFDVANNTDIEKFSKEYWEMVNSSDEKYSKIKKKTVEIIKKHLENGDEVFVITARPSYGKEGLVNFLNKALNIPKENIFFEPESKVQRIKELKLDYFYGDSDNDIQDAIEAGSVGIRIKRSPLSGYKKKYNPGKFNEKIIEDSEE